MQEKLRTVRKTDELKLIGAGFGRTGTLSLKAALEELGFGPCYHMTELFHQREHVPQWEAAAQGDAVDWQTLFAGYQATVDWPACSFYAELMEAYPDAKVILSIREPESWYESTKDTIYQIYKRATSSPFVSLILRVVAPAIPGIGRVAKAIVWERTFGGNFENKDYAISVFNQHIEEVKQRVPSDKLLVFQVKEGWGPLCAFLGVDEPKKPFPHLNERGAGFVGNTNWASTQKRARRMLLVAGVLVVLLLLGRQIKRWMQ